jgi:hypothetical protein|tara:strand:+ start:304 stop:435 length:132 start_codon:yes stop_codon:yes gene_type:complete
MTAALPKSSKRKNLFEKKCEGRTYHYKRAAVFAAPSPIGAYQN